ncbi:hypothetical protein [Pseudomonas wenzhouensis]|uniref:hypothetical protein n=1 Tax=Pseudomonas wenzhouensis TaxID=2906062 RepID=UPI001E5C227D|nr:hypothetical protein [Pseudomonas wenzhouensis]UFQ96582.1 hypothetical protein J7655_14900 [Pseudomonas wenzhouensis]
MSHYKPYPDYKDSGVEWLGRVPEHWVSKKLGNKLLVLLSAGHLCLLALILAFVLTKRGQIYFPV